MKVDKISEVVYLLAMAELREIRDQAVAHGDTKTVEEVDSMIRAANNGTTGVEWIDNVVLGTR